MSKVRIAWYKSRSDVCAREYSRLWVCMGEESRWGSTRKKSSIAGKLSLTFQSKIQAIYSSGFDYIGTLEFKTTSYSDNSAATELIILAAAEVGKDNNIAYSGDIEFTGVGIYLAISLDVVKKKAEAIKGAKRKGGKNENTTTGNLESEWKLIRQDGFLPIIPNVSLMKDIFGEKQIAKKKT